MGNEGNNITILAAGTYVNGDLFSDDLMIIEGGVEGNVVGNRVIVKKHGWVQGALTCRSLSIELGGVVNGMIRVSSTQNLMGSIRMTQLPEEGETLSLPPQEDTDQI